MRDLINIVESAQMVTEDVNQKDWVFYHGTDSDPFSKFEPNQATKGETFWNPLGNGMYCTNHPPFARQFGSKVHKVIIPAGSTYKRIPQSQWYGIGRTLVFRALKQAFKSAGESYDEWENGKKADAPNFKKMTREQKVEWVLGFYKHYANFDEIQRRAHELDDAALDQQLKHQTSGLPRTKDDAKDKALFNFKIEAGRLLRQYSPYEGLYEIHVMVRMDFGHEIGDAFEDILPKMSDQTFGKYDFVVFTETNDVIGDGNGKSSLEVVVFNPNLQKTVS